MGFYFNYFQQLAGCLGPSYLLYRAVYLRRSHQHSHLLRHTDTEEAERVYYFTLSLDYTTTEGYKVEIILPYFPPFILRKKTYREGTFLV